MRGLSGSLFSLQFLRDFLPAALAGELGENDSEPARRRARAVLAGLAALGPASPVRAVFDLAAAPLVRVLGYRSASIDVLHSGLLMARLTSRLDPVRTTVSVVLVVSPWETSLDRVWRDAVVAGIDGGIEWAGCHNGRVLRVLDARRTFARRYLEFDLDLTLRDPSAFAALWGLLRAEAFVRPRGAVIDRALALSNSHQVSVGAALERGVRASVSELAGEMGPRAFDQALTIVYRILFLLFAEARGLVPMWHPTYRDGYAIGSLIDRALAGQSRGLWSALQAASRLAHAGCHAGELVVTPFNGRLFEPARTPLGESRRVSDSIVRSVLLALASTPGDGGRRRVSYGDLGVEQLGAVYESVLDFTATPGQVLNPQRPGKIAARASPRKQTGSFYTPRSLTDYLVRRTLHPLVEGRSAREILSLRILDLAMGSGAFLVSACRYLAAACERAAIDEGETVEDISRLRRLVAQRCLYGVDLNPTAVQLGRLSLWLATLAADRPLTFLDHRLRDGDSLVGASLDDLARQAPGGGDRHTGPSLFEPGEALERSLGQTTLGRARIADDPGDTLAAVRGQERALAALAGRDAPLARWRDVADLWCAVWFWPDRRDAPDRREYGALAAEIDGHASLLPADRRTERLNIAAATARTRRFFHWTLEFPEVFYDTAGAPLPSGGFDAILGNPPWEMLRGDHQESGTLLRFARAAGQYRLQGRGHANLSQLFLERALRLLAQRGRLGLVLPSGIALDHGSAALRRYLFDRCAVDSIVSFENRDAIFPIHRSLRFLLVTATRGGPTKSIACRFGERDPRALDRISDEAAPREAFPITLTPELLTRLSGDQLTIPELRKAIDLRIAEKASAAPALGSSGGWGARFGRELNATDDRAVFRPARPPHSSESRGWLPVIEGKQLTPFAIDLHASRFSLRESDARSRLRTQTFMRPRLAYRDVASSGNRLSLIAAIVPAGCVTTHTVFCLKQAMSAADQHVLCALLNSYVANFLVRQRIGTHLSAVIVERLPVPRPERGSILYEELRALASKLAIARADVTAAARLQARAAQAYDLSEEELLHVLDTFPLVPIAARDGVMAAWRTLR
jgi:hypothetical protein